MNSISKNLLLVMLISISSLSACKGQKATIALVDYSFSGCFSGGKARLIITNENDTIYASCEEEKRPTRKTVMTSKKIKSFDRFIKGLKAIKPDGLCTTQEYYLVYYKKEKIEVVDGTCKWDGFDKLKKDLFGLEQEVF